MCIIWLRWLLEILPNCLISQHSVFHLSRLMVTSSTLFVLPLSTWSHTLWAIWKYFALTLVKKSETITDNHQLVVHLDASARSCFLLMESGMFYWVLSYHVSSRTLSILSNLCWASATFFRYFKVVEWNNTMFFKRT